MKDIRNLRGVIERDKAAIGVLITMDEPTKPMRQEAAEAGFFSSTVWMKEYPRLQILTVAELLAVRQVERPPTLALDETYKRAPKAQPKGHEQTGLGI